MPDAYRIFGSELSPYSVKVRSYFRYKKLPHEWILRSSKNEEEFRRSAKLPLIPLVVTPSGEGLQDSTPIIEHFERLFPEPPIQPRDERLGFLSALVEEYADEWGNKPMFHYRWTYAADRDSAAERLAAQMFPDADADGRRAAAEAVKGRMVPRLRFVGSSAETRETIEGSFRRVVDLVEAHLATRPYLFGGRPALADFGLYAQLYQCLTDPTPAKILREKGRRVVAWVERMLDPKAEGDFETWERVAPTLRPLLEREVGSLFFPWTLANERALAAGDKEFSLELGGRPYRQETQKYHAKSLAALRAKYAAVADRQRLDPILEAAGCLAPLRRG